MFDINLFLYSEWSTKELGILNCTKKVYFFFQKTLFPVHITFDPKTVTPYYINIGAKFYFIVYLI